MIGIKSMIWNSKFHWLKITNKSRFWLVLIGSAHDRYGRIGLDWIGSVGANPAISRSFSMCFPAIINLSCLDAKKTFHVKFWYMLSYALTSWLDLGFFRIFLSNFSGLQQMFTQFLNTLHLPTLNLIDSASPRLWTIIIFFG